MSTHRTDAIQVSRRYATAIFALAVEAKKAPAVVEELTVLAQAITQNSNLAETLANPLVSPDQKAAVLAALMTPADAMTRRAVATIAQGGRTSAIPTIAELLQAMLSAHQNEMEATITSARALTAATQKQLAQSLSKATGKVVKLKLKEDAEVLGGLKIELGSLRLDATLAGALDQMKHNLLAS